jgi:hypothetical protein
MKQELIKQMQDNIEACKNNTAYTIQDIELMKTNGAKMLSLIYDLNGTTYLFEEPGEEPKEIIIKIDGYRFGHNDFQVFCEGYYNVKSIKRIVYELKDENKIASLKGNGHGTALVFDYDCYKELS